MTIEIMKYTPVSKGVLMGFADIYLPKLDLEIYGCQFCNKNGKRWINMPQREYLKDGEKKYLSIVRFKDRDKQDAFSASVIKAIEAKIAEGGTQKKNKVDHSMIDDDLPF